jgi:hypothetical protein
VSPAWPTLTPHSSRHHLEAVGALHETALRLAARPESVPVFLLRVYPLSLERSALLAQHVIEERNALETIQTMYNLERERVEEEYKRGRDKVRERMLEGIEEKRRRAREEKDGEGAPGGTSSAARIRPPARTNRRPAAHRRFARRAVAPAHHAQAAKQVRHVAPAVAAPRAPRRARARARHVRRDRCRLESALARRRRAAVRVPAAADGRHTADKRRWRRGRRPPASRQGRRLPGAGVWRARQERARARELQGERNRRGLWRDHTREQTQARGGSGKDLTRCCPGRAPGRTECSLLLLVYMYSTPLSGSFEVNSNSAVKSVPV